MNEFDLIDYYFKQNALKRDDVILGIGDDAAILEVPKGMQLVVTTDTMVSGTHFLESANPAFVAFKALVSNISDLAAMGALPAWCSLALTLPKLDFPWLEGFCQAFSSLANQHNIALVGGDTTKGPLAISITLHGFVKANKALLRKGAKIGDHIFVTGDLGDSAAGLALILQNKENLTHNEEYLINRHFHKSPRVSTGQMLIDLASSCIDISDGLCADLHHILKINQVGAMIHANKLPISNALNLFAENEKIASQIALKSGEEYELCFTVSKNNLEKLNALALTHAVKITQIGEITKERETQILWHGKEMQANIQGWDHFRD